MIKFLWWELNVEEIFVGAFIQVPFAFVIGWWTLLLAPISGLLWAIGGSKEGEKIVRRLGVPVATLSFLVAYNTKYWPCAFAALAAFGLLSIGYDEDSVFYRFFYDVLKLNDGVCNFLTRLTAYALYWGLFSVGIAYSGV